MKCLHCRCIVSVSFSFCPYCGAALSSGDVDESLEIMRDTERIDKQIHALKQEKQRNIWRAAARTRWNNLIEYISEIEDEQKYGEIFDPSSVSINGVKISVFWEGEE